MPTRNSRDPDPALLRAVLRTDLPSFVRKAFATVNPGDRYVDNWHIEAICHELVRLRGSGACRRRLIVNLPPRSLKSLIVSVAFPAWVLGHDPSARIIVASYSDDLGRRLARDFRRVVEAPWYRDLFPAMRIDARKNTEAEVATTAGGSRYATSVGGTLTGRGGDLVVIDDPIKPMDAASDAERRRVNEWFDSTVMSRLDDPATAAVVLVMQRVHEDDLAGHLLEKGGWSLLRLPAIATEAEEVALGQGRVHRRAPGELLEPGRLAMAELEEARRHLGAQLFEAQYQQDPVPAGGTLIKADWLATYAGPPPGPDGFSGGGAELGRGEQGGRGQRLVGLHHLGPARRALLAARRAAGPARVPGPAAPGRRAGRGARRRPRAGGGRELGHRAGAGAARADAGRGGADPAPARQAGAGATGVGGVRGRPGAAAGAGAVGGRVPARAAGLPGRAPRRPGGQHHPVPDLGGGAAQAEAADPDRGHLHPQPAGLDFASGRRPHRW